MESTPHPKKLTTLKCYPAIHTYMYNCTYIHTHLHTNIQYIHKYKHTLHDDDGSLPKGWFIGFTLLGDEMSRAHSFPRQNLTNSAANFVNFAAHRGKADEIPRLTADTQLNFSSLIKS